MFLGGWTNGWIDGVFLGGVWSVYVYGSRTLPRE